MKKLLLSLVAVVAISSSAFALNLDLSANNHNDSSYGSVGVSDAAWAASVGFNNTKTEDDDSEVTATNIAIQVNGINALDSNLDLTYGVKYTLTSGETEAANGSKSKEHDGTNTLGLFVGLKTALTDSLSLTANYFPYQVKTVKSKTGATTTETKTTSLGGAVQVRATYALPL